MRPPPQFSSFSTEGRSDARENAPSLSSPSSGGFQASFSQPEAPLQPDHSLEDFPSRGERNDTPPGKNSLSLSEFRISPECATIPGLDSFLCGEKNDFSLRVLRDVAQGKAIYHPLFLRGYSGAGKTHLLRALALALARRNPDGQVYFLSGRDFAALFRQKAESRDAVRSLFRACAALIVDDVQVLAGQNRPQEELAYLLDALAQAGVPVLCSELISAADLTPLENASPLDEFRPGPDLLPILASRLCMGMTLELAEPDLDIRMRYALVCLAEQGLPPDRDAALQLARRCRGLRHVRGILLRMGAFYAQTGILPDEQELENLMSSSGAPQRLTPEALLNMVASRCGYTPRDLRGRKRDPNLVRARQIAMFLCREILGESYPSLGRLFGGKDHSTVMYAVKKIQEIQVMNKEVNILVTELTQRCKKHLA